MPDPVVIPTAPAPAAGFPDAAAHNAAVAQKLAAQDAAGHSTAGKPGEFEEASTALDKIVAALPQAPTTPAAPAAPATPPEPTAAELEAKKQAEEAAAAEAAKQAELRKKADEMFRDSPQLSEKAAPKSHEAFEAIKNRAVQEIQTREAKIAELEARVKDFETRLSTPTTEQLEKDKKIQELEIWRAKLDVDFDPKFKEFDSKIAQDREFIYAQLRRSPAVSEEIIEQIKKFGGPENSNLTKLFETIKDPTLQRIVESKIADLAMLGHQKEQALKVTKENMDGYLRERETTYREAATAHTTATQSELNKMLGALDWFKDKTGDEAHTKFLTEIKGQLADALRDDSPQMRAILLTGFAQMCKLKEEVKVLTGRAEKAEAESKTLTEKLAKIKESSTSRLRESNAPAAGIPAAPKPAAQFTTPAADALDALAKQVMEARAAKGL